MDFAWAINALKQGLKVTRQGWNGKSQYIELATCVSYKNTQGEIVNVNHDTMGNKAIAFVGTSGVQLGWLASQSDMLSDDWKEYKDDEVKLPKAGSMENCEKLSNAINQLLDKVNKMPQLHATVQPGPNDKELTVTIVEEEPDERIAMTLNVTEVCREAIGCTISNPDGITKSSIDGVDLNDKVED